MATDWRSAFFEQAYSDFQTLEVLRKEGAHTCQIVHYLQMTVEKLAKGFLTKTGSSVYPRQHDVVVEFIKNAPLSTEIGRALGLRDPAKLRAYMENLRDVALQIEQTVPTLAGTGRPNAEYPWADSSGVVAPVEYDFGHLDFQTSAKVRKLWEFVGDCFTVV